MTGQVDPEIDFSRDAAIARTENRQQQWDVVVIGGGATGIGIAMDAASRGLAVLLLERADFGQGTSSRSTKLVHGGVRYLRQGNITLVRDALAERAMLRRNAPHRVEEMRFLIPCFSWWQRFMYRVGLKLYDLLAGRENSRRAESRFTPSHGISAIKAVQLVPELQDDGLRGGVLYSDGQFDDARLLIDMARTAVDHGACLINYAEVTKLDRDDDGRIDSVHFVDAETDREYAAKAKCVVNAAGPFCDQVRHLDDPDCESWIAASQGIHLVLPKRLYSGDVATIVPKTSDGRVVFIIPWSGRVLVGTTDTALPEATPEPRATMDEIEFLIETANRFLRAPATKADILSVFTGIRPLVRGDRSSRTASLSRDHVIRDSSSGLVTIAGGKWTTVRKMSEDCVDHVIAHAGLAKVSCVTRNLKIRDDDQEQLRAIESESHELAKPIHPGLDVRRSEVVMAVRHRMARSVEDVLARRSRCLILNSKAASEAAPEVARLMADQLGRDEAWQQEQVLRFRETASAYFPPNA